MVGRVLHPAPALRSAALPFAHIGRVAASLPLPLPRRHGKDGGGGGGEERVVISEVAVRGKDGEPLELPEMEAAAAVALRACRPNAALTVREVQEVVHRVVESGLFRSCMPVAVDTRDSIRLVFEVQPNQDFHGLVCEGANMLPSKFLQEAFRDHHGKIINIRHLDQAIKSVNGWYQECGLTGLVSYAEILSGGILRLRVSKAGVNNINIRFLVVNQLLVRRNQKPYSGNLPPRRGQDKGSPVIRDFYNSQLAASGNAYDDTLVAKLERVYTDSGDHSSTMFVFNIEQGLPILPEWLSFNRVTVRLRQGYEIGPAWLLLSASGGHVKGKFSPHQAFAIGGTNSVRGYEEGAVGSGRSYAVGSGKVSCCMFGPLEGVVFGDYGVLKFLVTQQEPVRSQELVVGTVLASVRTPTGTFATRIRFQ